MHRSVGAAATRQLDTLELAALAYLLLPLVIFISGWLRWPVALLLGALLAWSCAEVWRRRNRVRAAPLGRRRWLLLAAAALAWVAASGLFGGLTLTEDWQVRMVVLRDLAVGAWPVGYGAAEGGELMLRFSMGYYLVPALVGQLLGVDVARAALGLWTALGVALFFALAAGPQLRRRGLIVLLVVLIAFSGMDIVGLVLRVEQWPDLGEHIEWWNGFMQYSSQTTLLFWAPNHALPAWLVTCIVWRHRDSGLGAAPLALALLAASLWSPLATLGLAPLAALANARGTAPRAWLDDVTRPAVLAVIPATLLLARFVTFGIPQKVVVTSVEMTEMQISLVPTLLPLLLRFAVFEWAAVAVVCVVLFGGLRRVPWLFWVAVVELLLLPLLRFGPGNDVVMRGGIAPVTLLALFSAALLTADGGARRWRAALVGLLLVGAATPLQEFARGLLPGERWADDGRNLRDVAGAPWHYVGVLGPGWLKQVLRDPVPLAGRR